MGLRPGSRRLPFILIIGFRPASLIEAAAGGDLK
jgi:hypothetical protein